LPSDRLRSRACMRPQPQDQDPTAPVRSNISQLQLLAPAAATSCWIWIQRIRSILTRVNNGQTGCVIVFLQIKPVSSSLLQIGPPIVEVSLWFSSFFCFGPDPLVSLQISPYTFFSAYLGRLSSVFSVLYVHLIVWKCRLVFCLCFVMLVLFDDCFLFILFVCLYVIIVECRE
jgi:hypothetical protein